MIGVLHPYFSDRINAKVRLQARVPIPCSYSTRTRTWQRSDHRTDGVDSSWADRVIWLPFLRTIALPNRPNKKRGGVSALVNLRWFPGSAASGQAGDQAWDVRPAVPASLSTVLGVSPACMKADYHPRGTSSSRAFDSNAHGQDVPSHCPHRPSGGRRRAVPRIAVQRWEHQHGDPRR